MKTVIFSCRMLETELRHVLQDTGIDHSLIWFEKGLHNTPAKLHDALQAALDALDADVERVILTFGYCGGCIAQLHTHAELIIPRVDDCITMLLGSHERRKGFCGQGGAYFLTEAWMDSDRSMAVEYDYAIQKYGEEFGKEIFAMMFSNYGMVALLDTGLMPLDAAKAKSQETADALGLRLEVVPATLDYLRGLVCGPWPDKQFITLAPGESLTQMQACTMMDDEGSAE